MAVENFFNPANVTDLGSLQREVARAQAQEEEARQRKLLTPPDVTTAFGQTRSVVDPATGRVTEVVSELAPETQALQQQLVGQAGGFLGQAQQFDVGQATQDQFARLEAILEPLRQQQRMQEESRLFAQGRLGSTGGALQQEATERAFTTQQLQNLAQAQTEAQNIQAQQQALGLQALQGAQAMGTGELAQLQLGGAFVPPAHTAGFYAQRPEQPASQDRPGAFETGVGAFATSLGSNLAKGLL